VELESWNKQYKSQIRQNLEDLDVLKHFLTLRDTNIHWPTLNPADRESNAEVHSPPKKKARLL
jgi:hypothetical protein